MNEAALLRPFLFEMQKEGVALPPPELPPGSSGPDSGTSGGKEGQNGVAASPARAETSSVGPSSAPRSTPKRPVESLTREELMVVVHKMRARIKLMERRHVGEGPLLAPPLWLLLPFSAVVSSLPFVAWGTGLYCCLYQRQAKNAVICSSL